MARVKNGAVTKARHKKVLKQAKGYFGSKHRLYKTAKEQLMHSGQYAYRDRKQKKREFRKLWITRINAACRMNDISYSRFIEGLTKAGVEVNRKMLSEIAINDPKMFSEFVSIAKGLETVPEGGIRCSKCFQLRLEFVARLAKEKGYDFFGTSLTVSPYKNAQILNKIGEDLEQKYIVKFLYSDFKKQDGYKKSIQLSREYHLYRQDYCGCKFSKVERELQKRGRNQLSY